MCYCKIYGNLNLTSGKEDFPLVTISNNVSENLLFRKLILIHMQEKLELKQLKVGRTEFKLRAIRAYNQIMAMGKKECTTLMFIRYICLDIIIQYNFR